MKRFRFAAWIGVVAILLNSGAVTAQTQFKSALQDKYGFKSVSCFTCHSKKTEVSEEEWDKALEAGSTKKLRNEFGKLFDKQLVGKKITARLAEVKGLEPEDSKRVAVEAQVVKEFLDALKTVEALKTANGSTYADALKKGEVDGVTLP